METTTGELKSTRSMTEQNTIIETIEITRRPFSERLGFVCPHCTNSLPLNAVTKCDSCGAHLDLLVRTNAPPIKEEGEINGEE